MSLSLGRRSGLGRQESGQLRQASSTLLRERLLSTSAKSGKTLLHNTATRDNCLPGFLIKAANGTSRTNSSAATLAAKNATSPRH